MSLRARVRRELARTNYAGRTVSLAEGAAVVAGATAALALAGRPRMAGMVGGIGVLGLVDDLVEPHRRRADGAAPAKGLRGHLRALTRGEVTTGAVKVLGIPIIALAGVAPAGRPGPMTLVDGALVAGGANLVNLLDLRPGRALKVVLPLAAVLAVRGERAAPGPAPATGGDGAAEGTARPRGPALTALLAGGLALPADLREHGMLGDAGANALGALVAAAAVRTLPAPARVAALLGVAGLTLASERVSFSRVIDATPALRALDGIGRRAAPEPEAGA